MPTLLPTQLHPAGVQFTDAVEVDPSWAGEFVIIEFEVPTAENVAGRSVEFYVETGDTATGPWARRHGNGCTLVLPWTDRRPGNRTTKPSTLWEIEPDLPGLWVRGVIIPNVSFTFGMSINVVRKRV